MYIPKDCHVKVTQMTDKELAVLRDIMSEVEVALMDVRLHLPKSDENYDLIWPLCFKKKKGWCINGYAYVDVQLSACILRIKEYIPVKWTEQMEYDLLKSVEKKVKSKGIKLPVWLLVGTLTVHAIA